ncbi:hypothetical protein BKI52_11245 [marine bacterium AO1-C]|nr:hypothetical protein BKI52_11245 [marine bacterium AO1-C]
MNSTTNNIAFTPQQLQTIYDAVFRDSTDQPGFYFQDFGSELDSSTFRQKMIALKEGLSNICTLRSNKRLNFQGMGRFNHQHSSRFHRDSAEPHSFLMLGYEPTQVESNVYVADYTKYIEEHRTSLEAYFGGSQDVNTANDEELLAPYITQLAPFPKNHYRLLLVNNSKSFTEKTLGVFHRGEVLQLVEGEDRILNYMMLHLCDQSVEEQYDELTIRDFINTEKVNR